MSASTDTVAYPDDVLVNGALTRHLDFDGNDYGLASSNHDRAIEQMLHAEQDGEDIIFGSLASPQNLPTAEPILPPLYGEF